ncbi:hypothetical protein CR513_18260, partial [Mucuna pruriens]
MSQLASARLLTRVMQSKCSGLSKALVPLKEYTLLLPYAPSCQGKKMSNNLEGTPSGHIGITMYTENLSRSSILLTIFNESSFVTRPSSATSSRGSGKPQAEPPSMDLNN